MVGEGAVAKLLVRDKQTGQQINRYIVHVRQKQLHDIHINICIFNLFIHTHRYLYIYIYIIYIYMYTHDCVYIKHIYL